MDAKSRLNLIREVGEEIITEDDLLDLLSKKKNPIAYDGFEPSGKDIHIAQGLLRAANINKMTRAGVCFKMWVADWHAWANNKMGGNLEHIQKVGEYLIEVWKACGMDIRNVEFVWAKEAMKDPQYWNLVMNIARLSTVKRITRCSQIMGRSESESLQASQIFYPCMQCADIFYLKADITQLGLDQRKVNVLARELGPKLGYYKPVIVSHHMLMGLCTPAPKIKEIDSFANAVKENKTPTHANIFDFTPKTLGFGYEQLQQDIEKHYPLLSHYVGKTNETAGGRIGEKFNTLAACVRTERRGNIKELHQELTDLAFELRNQYFEQRQMSLKMSKSKPDSAIFMTDSEEDIRKKISKAYCPEGEKEENPILEYCRYLLFEMMKSITVERQAGGAISYDSYGALEAAFVRREIHPADLKEAVSLGLNTLLLPARKSLASNRKATALQKEIQSFEVTR